MERRKKRGRKAQGHKGHTQKQRTSNPEPGLTQNDVTPPNPTGSDATERGGSSTTTLNVCTYNTRTLRTDDDLNRLMEDLEHIKWDVVGISETKREGEGLIELPSGHQIYEVGKTEENKTRKGIAILVNKRLKDYIEEFKTHTDRIVSCKIKLKGEQTLQIIQVYAPTSSYEDEEVEMFYEEIEKATDRKQCKH